MNSWLGRFLSRSEVEDIIDRAKVPEQPPRFASDFWDGSVIAAFKGPAGHTTPYMDTTNVDSSTARLVFVLAMDGFNPFQSKPGKGSVTSTGIYMICLNLPPHLRYLPENLYFVGAIPGKPSTDQINHFLRLIVRDLLPLWETGVFLSRTTKHARGRLVNGALIPIVADLLASRQLLGLGAINMTFFCSCCYLTLDEMENFDPGTWPSRNIEEHRRAAEAWRDAPSTQERERLFKENGIRWTELLRLPYWDPLQFAAIDSMHNHYLGLLENHCRVIWGMNVDATDGLGFAHPTRTEPARPSKEAMDVGVWYLLHGTQEQLRNHAVKAVLWYLCAERGLRRASTVSKMIAELMRWSPLLSRLPTLSESRQPALSRQPTLTTLEPDELAAPRNHSSHQIPAPPAEPQVPRSGGRKTHVLGKETLAAVHADVERTELPSWVSHAPKNFGSKTRGKLSADQWRTVCTIHLPITLIRIWQGPRELQMLDNFMDLVAAVEIGGMMQVSEEHIQLYEAKILSYLRGMKSIYLEATVKPNHHLAYHLAMFLRRFGPVHSWRAYAFERFNYMLQNLNTNMHIGELELTFMNQICRAANLRPLLRDHEVQKAIFEVINAFNEIFHEDGRGTRISDNLRLVEDAVSSRGQKQKKADQVVKLEDDVYAALLVSVNGATGRDLYVDHNAGRKMPEQEYLRSDATRLTRIFKGGVTYKACSDSRKDSHVLLDIHPEAGQPLGPSQWPPASLVAADILHIFSHKRFYGGGWIEETFLAINRLMPLSDYDTGRDIYRKYETAGGFLCYDRYCETIEIVRPDTIISHFAKTTMDIQQIEPRCVHVLPLDRMMQLISLPTFDDSDVDAL
ncbi:hypothetical protein PHLCEN_2v11851 [Hermanssonia centrifuga]|uniref:Transposase n=1 Tax=Hermanssonia centrifuga TaxID=98765 RepID=A0A2R6NIR1_9APHY|nr:hypothetical protein PHLCEN_2v11851 [Hermanssonia centrifuga]